MVKTMTINNLGCAACAAKMEHAIQKLDGVREAKVNFLFQRLTIIGEDGRMDEILREAARICRKIEPDCRPVL